MSEYVSNAFIQWCTVRKQRQNLLYSYSGNRIRLKMWSSKSSSIRHQGWMLCWKSPARKLHFTCFQHFSPRQNNNNHFTNNRVDALHRIVILRCNDTTGWQNLLLPCDFQELFIKSGKCGTCIYFIENSWRLQWNWSSSESAFCHFYYTL